MTLQQYEEMIIINRKVGTEVFCPITIFGASWFHHKLCRAFPVLKRHQQAAQKHPHLSFDSNMKPLVNLLQLIYSILNKAYKI